MNSFWQSVLDDLVFQHCDGEGLKPVLSEWLGAEDFDLEYTPNGFELVPWDHDVNEDRIEFSISPLTDGLIATNERGSFIAYAFQKEIGRDRLRAIEVILREVQRCGISVS